MRRLLVEFSTEIAPVSYSEGRLRKMKVLFIFVIMLS
jgi:hypothetical protein